MRKVILMMLLAVVSSNAMAEPVKFKCKKDSIGVQFDVVVDTEKMTMTWGVNKITISSIHENFITAYDNFDLLLPGGEVTVLNRNTGDYFTGGVAVNYDTWEEMRKSPDKASVFTTRGRCTKPLL